MEWNYQYNYRGRQNIICIQSDTVPQSIKSTMSYFYHAGRMQWRQ